MDQKSQKFIFPTEQARKTNKLNKYLYSLANTPRLIRTIISNLSNHDSQDSCAETIATHRAQHYLQQSNTLFDFNKMLQLYNEKVIEFKNKITQGDT